MRNTITHVLFYSLIPLSMAGCDGNAADKPIGPVIDPDDADTTVDDVSREAGEAVETTTDFAASKVDTFKAEMRQKIDEVDDRVDQLAKQAEQLPEAAKTQADETIQSLRQQSRSLSEQVDELSTDSIDAWSDAKDSVMAGWKQLRTDFDLASDQIKDKRGGSESD